MYSLYRAWLMRDAMAAASLATPPDVIIEVGQATPHPNQFVAHRHLISMHSGYLKALILQEPPSLANSDSTLMSISVPSLTPDTFAPLLSFMYTGFLDVNNDNIYSILLATHLLHMPRALDLCRAYLVHNQRPFNHPDLPPPLNTHTTTNIVKPIPSRKLHHYNPSFWSPVMTSSAAPSLALHTTPNGPFQSVGHEKLQVASEPDQLIDVENRSPLPSTSKISVCVSPSPSTGSATSDDRTVTTRIVKSPVRRSNNSSNSNSNNKRREQTASADEKNVVIDIACCDGPVQFHRVLNESYGHHETNNEVVDQDEAEYLKNYPNTQFLNNKRSEKKFKDYMSQQLENAKGVIQLRKLVEADENSQSDDSDKIYTCVYCNHTFKSQYCYQKHARRHINPVDGGGAVAIAAAAAAAATTTTTTNSANAIGKSAVIMRKMVKVDEKKREVRLLDMNVQYYPCKTCGSKFPSYYFVHKHRKMCHNTESDVIGEQDHNSNSTSNTSELPSVNSAPPAPPPPTANYK